MESEMNNSNNSKILQLTDGYYYFLFHGSKMVPSISNGNCYWEIMYLKVIKENSYEMIGQRKLTSGVWVCGVGSTNWTKIFNIRFITLKQVIFPELPPNEYDVEKIDIMETIRESIKGK